MRPFAPCSRLTLTNKHKQRYLKDLLFTIKYFTSHTCLCVWVCVLCVYPACLSLFLFFFFFPQQTQYVFYTSLRNVRSLPPLATDQSNPLCYRMRRRGCVRRLEQQRTRKLSFTERGRKTADEMRIHFPGFYQGRSRELRWPNNMQTTHFHTHLEEKFAPPPP